MDIHLSESLESNCEQADGCMLIILGKEDISEELKSFVDSKVFFSSKRMHKINSCPAGHPMQITPVTGISKPLQTISVDLGVFQSHFEASFPNSVGCQ
jgi:hypothetical protein